MADVQTQRGKSLQETRQGRGRYNTPTAGGSRRGGCRKCKFDVRISQSRSAASPVRSADAALDAGRRSYAEAPVERDRERVKGKRRGFLLIELAATQASLSQRTQLSSHKAGGITDQESRSACSAKQALRSVSSLFFVSPQVSVMVSHSCSSATRRLPVFHEKQNRVSYSCSFLNWMIATGPREV